MLLAVLCLLISRPAALGCVIAGTDSGYCDPMTLEPEYRSVVMPYCAPKVQYIACVPRQQSLPPDRRFEHGRWSNHTTLKKVGSSYSRSCSLSATHPPSHPPTIHPPRKTQPIHHVYVHGAHLYGTGTHRVLM